MKIISALLRVRLDEDEADIEAVAQLEQVLSELGFDGTVNITSMSDDLEQDILHISFDPVAQ